MLTWTGRWAWSATPIIVSSGSGHEYGMDEFICYFNQGGIMDDAMVRQSMTLFAKEVMPHCR